MRVFFAEGDAPNGPWSFPAAGDRYGRLLANCNRKWAFSRHRLGLAASLLVSQRSHGLDSTGAPGGRCARRETDRSQAECYGQKRKRVVRRRIKEQLSDQSCSGQRGREPDGKADANHPGGAPRYQSYDSKSIRAQGHAQTDFERPLRHIIRHHPIEADRGE
jgi:hypothetical protein